MTNRKSHNALSIGFTPRSMSLDDFEGFNCYKFECSRYFADFADLGANNG